MLLRRSFILAIISLLPFFSYAQITFLKGYRVTNLNDTIKGLISIKENRLNPTSFKFKVDDNAKVETFDLKNSIGYGVDGVESYHRNIVNISMSTININKLSLGLDTTKKRDTVFLKVLQKGKNIILFSYEDVVKERFYIQEKNTKEPIELIRHIFNSIDGSSNFVTRPEYRKQLQTILEKNAIKFNQNRIDHLDYDAKDLIKIASLINNEKPIKSQFSSYNFFVGFGLDVSNASYRGKSELNSAETKTQKSAQPFFNAGVDFFINPAVRRTVIRVDLSYSAAAKYEISSTKMNETEPYLKHTFKQSNIALTPQIFYNLYNNPNQKIFVGLGFSFNLSNYKDNIILSNYSYSNLSEREGPKLEKFYTTFPLVAGATISKKIGLTFNYTMPTSFTKYSLYAVRVERYRLGVNYLFGR